MQHVHRELVAPAWSVTKSVTRQKSKALEIFFPKFCQIQKGSIYIFTLATPLVAPKMVKKFWAKTKRNVDVWDSPPQPFEFFYPYSQSLYRWSGARAYTDVETKFSGIDRFPFSIGMRLH